MFWGLVMDPNKWYTQIVKIPFHVSMATLDIATVNNELVEVILCYKNTNYKLCSLKTDSVWQVPLDLNFQKGMKIAFTCNGQSHVHLTGYFKLNEAFDLDDEEEEEEEEEGIDDDDNDNDEEKIPKRSNKQIKKNKLIQKQWQKQMENQDKQKLVVVASKKNNKERNKKRKI